MPPCPDSWPGWGGFRRFISTFAEISLEFFQKWRRRAGDGLSESPCCPMLALETSILAREMLYREATGVSPAGSKRRVSFLQSGDCLLLLSCLFVFWPLLIEAAIFFVLKSPRRKLIVVPLPAVNNVARSAGSCIRGMPSSINKDTKTGINVGVTIQFHNHIKRKNQIHQTPG